MRIKVTKYYQGFNTNQQMIHEGVYQVGDERLFGLEDYLVNVQQKAEYVEDEVLSPSLVADDIVVDASKKVVVVEHNQDHIVVEEQPADEVQEIEFKGRTIKAKKAK
jgi:hypothetical protein